MFCFHICAYFYGQKKNIYSGIARLKILKQKKLTFSEPFKYHGWELSAEDLDEEAEDLSAEGEAEEEEAEEEENEDEEVSMLALSIYAFILTHLLSVWT